MPFSFLYWEFEEIIKIFKISVDTTEEPATFDPKLIPSETIRAGGERP
jgi:hypothetical protein